MFYAVLMSGPGWKRFSTREEAWDWVERCRCSMCRSDMVCRPYETCFSCDAEWDVWEQHEWDEFGPLPAEDEWNYVPKPLPKCTAGFLCIWSTGGWALHLGVRWKHWYWGWTQDWYDYIGLGAFFLWTRN